MDAIFLWVDLALWLRCSSTSWKSGFDSRRLQLSGLVAQFCNPTTGGQGYVDGAGYLGLNTWLGLDLLFHH